MVTTLRKKSDQRLLEEDEDKDANHIHEPADFRGDELNIAALLFLYTLQGIPLGLCGSIPMMLQNRGVSYQQQAKFSFTQWPFSLKLLWAPIVDSVFHQKFGRRKTWLIPTQYLMGLLMLFLSSNVDDWLNNDNQQPNIGQLTAIFFILNVLAATQDIAVDGWALTMLKRKNVTYASTCNSIGQTAGFFIGYVLFMALESSEFCNKYLRSTPSTEGIFTFSGFLYFWGWVFIIATTMIAIFKHENIDTTGKTKDLFVVVGEGYKLLWSIIKLPLIQVTMMFLLTSKIGFAAVDSVTGLKLIEAGFPKEQFALIAVPMIPLQIVLPLIISKYTAGPRPMDVYIKAYPFRLLYGIIGVLLVWITPFLIDNSHIPSYYYFFLIFIFFIHQILISSMFVASMAFFAKVSDPTVGGTYMTLLNTLNNLGGNWPSTTALWLVDLLTFRKCDTDPLNDCSTPDKKQTCANTNNGVCDVQLDGYYIEILLCIIIGFSWFKWVRRKLDYLQKAPMSGWKVQFSHQKR